MLRVKQISLIIILGLFMLLGGCESSSSRRNTPPRTSQPQQRPASSSSGTTEAQLKMEACRRGRAEYEKCMETARGMTSETLKQSTMATCRRFLDPCY